MIAVLAAIITALVTRFLTPRDQSRHYKYSWSPSESAQLTVYLSEAPIQVTFEDPESRLVLQQHVKLIRQRREELSMTIDVPFNPSWSLQAPLFAHIFLCRKGAVPTQFPYPASDCVYRRYSLIHHRPSQWPRKPAVSPTEHHHR